MLSCSFSYFSGTILMVMVFIETGTVSDDHRFLKEYFQSIKNYPE